jgi:hypothetical protein
MNKLLLFLIFAIVSNYSEGEVNNPSNGKAEVRTVQKAKKTESKKRPAYWKKMAGGMSQALIDHFWGAKFEGYSDRYYFNYGSDLSNMTTNHY